MTLKHVQHKNGNRKCRSTFYICRLLQQLLSFNKKKTHEIRESAEKSARCIIFVKKERKVKVKATRCCVAVFTGTTGEAGMLLCDSLALVISKGDVLLSGRLAYTTGEGKNGICICVYNWQGDVLLRGCFCMVLVLATRCCVTVFACTSNSGNLLFWHTIRVRVRVRVRVSMLLLLMRLGPGRIPWTNLSCSNFFSSYWGTLFELKLPGNPLLF